MRRHAHGSSTARPDRGLLVKLWPEGPLQRWHPDGTLETLGPATGTLSAWESECARLRYVEMLTPAAIARATGRSYTAVNSALNRGRAKADARWLTYRQARKCLVPHTHPASPPASR